MPAWLYVVAVAAVLMVAFVWYARPRDGAHVRHLADDPPAPPAQVGSMVLHEEVAYQFALRAPEGFAAAPTLLDWPEWEPEPVPEPEPGTRLATRFDYDLAAEVAGWLRDMDRDAAEYVPAGLR